MKPRHLSVFLLFIVCAVKAQKAVVDTPFRQEYHEAYTVGKTPQENEVRSIAADHWSTIWIATAAGIYTKKKGDTLWNAVFAQHADNGPAYAVAAGNRSSIWMGTWKGVYLYRDNELHYVAGTTGPISVICIAREGVYALGPEGVWLHNGTAFIKKPFPVARSVRSAISDGNNGIWVATDVGLYHCNAKATRYYYQTDRLISAYVKGLAMDSQGKLWAGGLGGISILQKSEKENVSSHQRKGALPSM